MSPDRYRLPTLTQARVHEDRADRPALRGHTSEGLWGTERVVANLCDSLCDLGHDVVLFAADGARSKARLIAARERALRLDPNPLMSEVGAHLTMLREVRKVAAGFDVLHFQTDLLHFPQEILGPYYPEHPLPDHDFDLTHIRGYTGRARGEVIELVGRVLRPDGGAIRNADIQVWQANAADRYRNPNDHNPAPLDPDFQGFARVVSGHDGTFRLLTVKPGPYPAPNVGMRTPHIHFDIHSIDARLVTQMYFPGEPLNATDAFLSTMPARHQNPALVMAHEERGAAGVRRFRWDVVLWS